MIYRTALIEDISQIFIVRNSVNENKLTNPEAITPKDCISYITDRGKGWVCEINKEIIGFSIVDLQENNVWALFIKPNFEKKGIGKQLHNMMLQWYFNKTKSTIWLGTTPKTRAEIFYRKAGWIEKGMYGKDEIKFEMSYQNWIDHQ